MKVNEIKEKTVEELQKMLNDINKDIFSLKFKKATGQLENTMRIRNLKKDVARIKTLIREKENNLLENPDLEGLAKKK